MKRILKYLPILLVFFGCDSFLDRESYDKMDSDGYYNSTTALNSAVIACYNGIQDALDKEFFLTEVRSDNSRNRNQAPTGNHSLGYL